jgi:hypothetical protein
MKSLARNPKVSPRSCESVIWWSDLLDKLTLSTNISSRIHIDEVPIDVSILCWECNEYKQVFVKVEHWNIMMVLYRITEVYIC